MEVLVGPTFGVASSAATFVRDRPQEKISSSSCLFLKEDDVVGGADDPTGDGSGSDRGSPELSSDSSSSIGVPGDSSDEEEEEDGVVSSGPSLGLASLSSIEDSLPIKRGLSNHYAGKSKSFASLSDISSVSSVKDLQKPENPFNKRRRVLIANKWARKSFYSWQNPNSMPLLAALNEDDEDGDDKENPSSSSSSSSPSSSSLSSNDKLSVAAAAAAAQKPKLQQSKLRATFKSQSCFSLTDLQVEHQ